MKRLLSLFLLFSMIFFSRRLCRHDEYRKHRRYRVHPNYRTR